MFIDFLQMLIKFINLIIQINGQIVLSKIFNNTPLER